MSKLTISALLLGVAAAVGAMPATPAAAADLAVPAPVARVPEVRVPSRMAHPTPVVAVDLRSGLRPAELRQTEPHYYYGPVRAYPRYAVEGAPPVE